ncbi:hypothetical protein PR202_gb29291 [Eleusine coracana subsp. coracana]|uniref:Uncharacterized protein n=1 Tax=Eleusine coracana subsp. coracana TaxID=191504 RepID=A0AAV5FYM1_ELECO|nr:hypothetical protein PR202_gb29291 [Eleusine coracana subsp. coracana]
MRAHVVVSLLGEEAGVPIQARRRLRPSPSSLFDEVLPSEAASPISLVVLVLIGGFSPSSGQDPSRSSTLAVAKIPSPLYFQPLASCRGLDPCSSTPMMDFARSVDGAPLMVSSGFHSLLFPSSEMSFTIARQLFDVRLED